MQKIIIVVLMLAFAAMIINYRQVQKIWSTFPLLGNKRNPIILKLRWFLRSIAVFAIGITVIVFEFYDVLSSKPPKCTQYVYFLLDASASMRAKDVLPTRFEKAKEIIAQLAKLLRGSHLGIIPFSNFAEVYCPLTNDLELFQNILSLINIQNFNLAGASFRKALAKAEESFDFEKINAARIIIILTDGENNKEYFLSIISKLKKKNYTIFCISVGTEKGAPIPIDDKGNYLKNPESSSYDHQPIISKMDKSFLQSLTTESTFYTYQDYTSILSKIYSLEFSCQEKKSSSTIQQQIVQNVILLAILSWFLSFFCKPRV
ncbi:MAG: VWA domain-containing protein [Bacteroidia bacterium]|nr:VWA domain-containing protein [Bacteroidia bacterium]MDW8159119.1 VWA domain-containing protein [Bacteroidia bacterium]